MLMVRKSQPLITNLLSQNAILLDDVLDDVLLPLVQPARNGNDEKRKWIQTRPHRASVSRAAIHAAKREFSFRTLRLWFEPTAENQATGKSR